ncbi:hypothetical protein [Novacetimonas pomaceti]|uniref:hypothetical protein n=1 Tax=Novacetimonas pomaceti TaxID=2021998 RepID=UPI001C2CE504|nr:hypothetical protein [Novacetimonas pomaceti]MBV1833090.1 hypothetical protein [Novacetimonas pomaceti]
MAECDHWERIERAEPDNLRAKMKAIMEAAWRLLEIKKRRGIRPYVEEARQNWWRRRQVVPLAAEKARELELIG